MFLGNSTRAPGSNGCPSIMSLLAELCDASAIAGNPESTALIQLSCHSLEGFAPEHDIFFTLRSACRLGLMLLI